MQFHIPLATICLFVASAFAAANVDAELFEVSNLKVDRILSGNFSISFTVHDPDPLTNATQDCSGSWAYGSKGYPQGSYALCGNSTFGWNMASFTGFQRFTIGIEHALSDPSIGEPPYDSIITFGKAVINKKNLECQSIDDRVDCAQKPDIIKSPISAVSA